MKQKPISQLYHQFLKPENISINQIDALSTALNEHRFIDFSQTDPTKYFELPKLINKTHKSELFKIIGSLKK